MCEVYTQTTMKHQKVCPRGEASVRCVGSAPRVRFMGAQRVRDFSVHMCTYVNGKEMCVSASCLEVQAHPLSVFRTLYSGKDGDSTGGGPYMLGKQYTIADVAIWTWYGLRALDPNSVDGEFLGLSSYPNVMAWAQRVADRKAVQRGQRVNKVWGDESEQLAERHSRTDFD
mmetsp:Transcript_39917/g.77605  ORF Transcript_39917/g.77605 Transcript_39917/m.77605 type:complete len:171 (-) Transcript_39917:255-767(-)